MKTIVLSACLIGAIACSSSPEMVKAPIDFQAHPNDWQSMFPIAAYTCNVEPEKNDNMGAYLCGTLDVSNTRQYCLTLLMKVVSNKSLLNRTEYCQSIIEQAKANREFACMYDTGVQFERNRESDDMLETVPNTVYSLIWNCQNQVGYDSVRYLGYIERFIKE